MRASTQTHRADDGASIRVYRWLPDEGCAVRAVVHVVHGMAEHAARYARLGGALTDAGLAVYAHDQRGHGQTAGPGELGHLGDAGGWRRCLDDVRSLIRQERAAHDGRSLVLFGHSMGSFMVQELLFELSEDLAAAILCGSSGKPAPLAAAGRVVARLERLRVGARGTSRLLTRLSFDAFNAAFAPNRTRFDWLTRDQDEVDRYVADPLCGFDCTTSTWVELLDALARIADARRQATIRKELPIFVMSGNDDSSNERARGARRLLEAYSHAGLTRVTSRFYDGARHELLNETNRAEVTRELIDWLDGVLPKVGLGVVEP